MAKVSWSNARVGLCALLLLGACKSSTDGGGGNGDGGDGNGDAHAGLDLTGCINLECQLQSCTGGAHTTISGKVYDPGGNTPLYNAIVYIPNGTIDQFMPGLQCGACAAGISGNPVLAPVLTGPD